MTKLSNSQDTPTKNSPARKPPAGASDFPYVQDGRYTFISVIGSGGAGTVYLAHDTRLNKDVAIKLLHDSTQTQIIRFQREARLLGSLRHENVMSALDFGITEKNEPYLVLDYVDGESLSKLLKRYGRLSENEVLGIFVQTAIGLAHAHKNNILHRDIKPSNVMLVEETRNEKTVRVAKIVDFGLAKDLEDQGSTLTGVGFGTPLYMSPEQSYGPDVDERSDIYSFGCLMYEVLTGQPPFRGESVIETAELHAAESIPSIPGDCGCSATMESIVVKCLSKNPDERYQTFDGLLVDLKKNFNALRNASEQNDTKTQRVTKPIDGSSLRRNGVLFVLVVLVVSSVVVLAFQLSYREITTAQRKETPNQLRRIVEVYTPMPKINDVFTPSHSLSINFYRPANGDITCFVALRATDRDLSTWLEENSPKVEQLYLEDVKFTDQGFKLLAKQQLKVLILSKTALTKDVLGSVGKLNSLVGLGLGGTRSIDYKALTVTLNGLPGLRRLELTDIPLNDELFEELAKLKQLTSLNLRDCTGITRKGIASLKSLKQLQEIGLNGTDTTDDALADVTATQVHKLSLQNTKVTDKLLPTLYGWSSLEQLNLTNTQVTRNGTNLLKQRSVKGKRLSVASGKQKLNPLDASLQRRFPR